MPPFDYDVLVIGAGTAGLVAADFAVKLGRRTALVERHRIGGDCTWTGCVPSKALIRAARAAHDARTAARFGIHTPPPTVDLAGVRAHVHDTIATIYQHETPEALAKTGITVLMGAARFTDPHTLLIDGRRVTANKIVLATGARARLPDLPGLETVSYWTYETLFDLAALPAHLVVIGSGYIGAEMAQAFARLGSRVTLIGEKLLPHDEPEAADVLAEVFNREGVRWLHGRALSIHTAAEGGIAVEVRGAARTGSTQHETVHGTHLLVATGRTPRTDGLDLAAAGVASTERGITVDDRLRTTQPHIYAAGDCTGGFQFTHVAGWQGYVAVRNALLPFPVRGTLDWAAWTTFTDPAIAHTGLTEADARRVHGDSIDVRMVRGGRIDRALVDGQPEGFIKVIADGRGRVLGATVVGDGAGEAITEWTVAAQRQRTAGDLATALHVYPTYATASQLIASGITGDGLLKVWIGLVLRMVARLR